jgi:hypothetical protein
VQWSLPVQRLFRYLALPECCSSSLPSQHQVPPVSSSVSALPLVCHLAFALVAHRVAAHCLCDSNCVHSGPARNDRCRLVVVWRRCFGGRLEVLLEVHVWSRFGSSRPDLRRLWGWRFVFCRVQRGLQYGQRGFLDSGHGRKDCRVWPPFAAVMAAK